MSFSLVVVVNIMNILQQDAAHSDLMCLGEGGFLLLLVDA
jgi:hypothetical protein